MGLIAAAMERSEHVRENGSSVQRVMAYGTRSVPVCIGAISSRRVGLPPPDGGRV